MDIWSLPWLPPVIFSVIILSGFSIGYLNGWKTGTYLFAWNLLGILISISTFIFVYPSLLNILPNKNIGILNIKSFIQANKNHAKPIFGLIYLIFILVLSNILAFSLYWLIPPLRKFLRKEIKINKKNGVSSMGIRFVGAGLGTISLIPFTAFSTSITTITHNQSSSFTRMNARLVKGLTFGKYKNLEKLLQDIRSFILINEDEELPKIISKIFGSDHITIPESLNKEQKKILEKVLHSQMIFTILEDPKLTKKFVGDENLSRVDFTKEPKKLNDSLIPFIDEKSREKIINSIVKGIVPNTKNKEAKKKDVEKYLKNLLGW